MPRRIARPIRPVPATPQQVRAQTFTYVTDATPPADPPPVAPDPTFNATNDDPKTLLLSDPNDTGMFGGGTPTVDPAGDIPIDVFRRLLAPPNFWSSTTGWNACTHLQHKWLMSALALKVATTSGDGPLATLQDAMGAASVERIAELSPQAPDGLLITLPGTVIFAIGGATRLDQLQYLRIRSTDTNYYARTTDIASASVATPTGGSASSTKKLTELGYLWGPFVPSANAWLDRIKTWWTSEANTGQEVVLIGHSLGAAVCELLASWASVWKFNVLPACQPINIPTIGVSTPSPYNATYQAFGAAWGLNKGPPTFSYGVVFGQPNVVFEGRLLLESARDPDYLAGMSMLPSRIARFDHPLDPVTQIPGTRRWSEILFNTNRDQPTKFTTRMPLRRQHTTAGWIGQNANALNLPDNIAVFNERVNLYHGIDTYIEQLRQGFVEAYGRDTGDWDTLITSIKALSGTFNSNWA